MNHEYLPPSSLHPRRYLHSPSLPLRTRHPVSVPRASCASSVKPRPLPRSPHLLDDELPPRRLDPRRARLLLRGFPPPIFRPLRLVLMQSCGVALGDLSALSCERTIRGLVLREGDEVRVWDAGVGGFQDRGVGTGLAYNLDGGILPGGDWGAAMGEVLRVREAGSGAENAASVGAVEGAGFGGWIEELRVGEGVDGEVVDGFVGGDVCGCRRVVGCCWNHAVDCASVR
jgi:hypothetical protein